MATRIADNEAEQSGASTWTVDSARTLYNVEGWGAGFFDVNEKGHAIVRPDKERPELVIDHRGPPPTSGAGPSEPC